MTYSSLPEYTLRFTIAAALAAACGHPPAPARSPAGSPTFPERAATATEPPLASSATPVGFPTSTPSPLIPFDSYILHVELSATSPWAEVEFLSPEVIVTRHIVSVTGSPEIAAATSTRIDLVRPISALATNPVASISLDLLLRPAAVSQPFVLLSSHGAMGGSEIRLSYQGTEGFTELRTINHYWVDPQNPDTSATRYLVDLSPLARMQPLHADLQRLAPERMLWAVFYPWIGWDLDAPCTDRPLVGYDNDDPAVLAAHIQDAQQAGIDGFLVSWVYDPDLNRRLAMLLDAAEETGFKVAIFLENTPYPQDRRMRPAEVQQWLASGLRRFGSHPAYMRLDDRPLVFIGDSMAAPLSTWQEMFDSLEASGLSGSYFASDFDLDSLGVFVGIYRYGVFGLPDLDATYREASGARYFPMLMSYSRAGIWTAPVHPGFDNCPYLTSDSAPYAGAPSVIDRDSGSYYRATFEAAVAADPDWIIITSWNEFGETTHIAPSVRYGDTYIRLTAELAAAWRMSPERDH